MKQTIKSILAFAAVLICGGAWATPANKPDESGTVPTYWLEFNGNFDSSGSQEISWGGSEKNNNFAEVGITGRDKAMRVVDGSTHPYSSDTNTKYLGNGNFTFTIVARTTPSHAKTVLAAIGTSGSFVGFYVSSTGDSVYFGTKDTAYLEANVPLAMVQYHSYVVTKSNSILTMYVDGVQVASSNTAPNCDLGGCQIGSVRGGTPDGFVRLTGSLIDDLRIYKGEVLDQSKIAAFANSYSVTPAINESTHTATISSNVNFTQAGWDNPWVDATAESVTINVTADSTLTVNEYRYIRALTLNVSSGKTLTLSGSKSIVARNTKLIGGGTLKFTNANGFTPLGETAPTIEVKDSIVELQSSSDWNYSGVSLSRITGNGKIKLSGSGYQALPVSAGLWAATIDLENNLNKGLILTENNSVYNIANLSGSGTFRYDWGENNTPRTLNIIQSTDTEWSGSLYNNDGRFTKVVVKGASGATSKTLTYSGTSTTAQKGLDVDATGSLKFAGSWNVNGTMHIAGEFGGNGTVSGATAVMVCGGARIRADWGAATVPVAPAFGGMTEVVASSIPNDGVKLFSIAGTASETSLGAVCFNVGGTLSKGKIVTKADGIYAVAEEGDVLAGKLKYHYDFNDGNFDNKGDTGDSSIKLNNAKAAIKNQQENGSLKMSADPGNYYSNDNGGFSYGDGDWTIVAIVKAPGANQTLFAMGGQSGTTGLIGLRNAGNNTIKAFTKNSTDLAGVTLDVDPTADFHAYAIVYTSADQKVKVSVDGGEFSEAVSFTKGTDSRWQFAGIHGGEIAGFAQNVSTTTARFDDFKLYTTALTPALVQKLVEDAGLYTAEASGRKFVSVKSAINALGGREGEVRLLKSTAESIEIPANVTIDPGETYQFTGALTGSGTIKLTKNSSGNGSFGTTFGSGSLANFQGTVWINKGRYASNTALESGVKIKVTNGGQLWATGGTWANAISVSGNGWSTGGIETAAIRIDGSTFSGTITAEVGEGQNVPTIGTHNNTAANVTGTIVCPDGLNILASQAAAIVTVSGTISGGAITTSGSGTVKFSEATLGSMTINASQGYVIVAESDYAKVTTSNTGAILLEETPYEYANASFELPQGLDGKTVKVKRPTGSVVNASEVVDDTTIKVNGASCLYDFTFNNSVHTAPGSRVQCDLSIDGGYSARYDTDGSLNAWTSPWRSMTDVLPSAKVFTTVVAGKMPEARNTIFVSFGSSDGTKKLLFIATGAEANKVVIGYGNKSSYEILTTIGVPHSTDARHMYAMVLSNNATKMTIYLDGTRWASVEKTEGFTFGNSDHSGIQIGSGFGGLPGINNTQQTTYGRPTENDTGRFHALRYFDYQISEAQMAALKAEFAYTSPAGKNKGVFNASAMFNAGTWTDKDGQTITFDEEHGLEDGAQMEIVSEATEDITITLSNGGTDVNIRLETESLDISGQHAVKFERQGTEPIVVVNTGLTAINTDVTVQYGAVTLTGGPTRIAENKTLTFDCSTLDISGVYETTFYPLTGDIDEDATVAVNPLPTAVGRTAALYYNAPTRQYGVRVTPNHQKGDTVYAKDGAFTQFVLSDGVTTTALFPTDIISIKVGIYDGDPWKLVFNKDSQSGHKIVFDYAGGSVEAGGNIYSDIPANSEIEIASGTTLYFSAGTYTINGGAEISGDGTLNLNKTATISGAVTISSTLVAGDGSFKLNNGATLTVPTTVATGKVVSNVSGSSVKQETNAQSKIVYSLIDTSSDPIEPSDDPSAGPVVIEDVGTGITMAPDAKVVIPTDTDTSKVTVKYGETTLTGGEQPLVTVSVNQETGAVVLTTTDNAKPAATDIAMSTPTEEETDKVQFTISNPIPGLFYSIVSANGPTDADFTAQTAVDSTGVQATNSDPHTTSIDMPTDAKVKYFRVRVKATK